MSRREPVAAPAAVDGDGSGRPSLAITAMVLTVFTVTFIAFAVHAYTQTSATWDEPIHFAAGYAGLVKQDFRVEPSHPPLLRVWAALPTVLVDDLSMSEVPADGVPTDEWLRDAYGFAHRFLYVDNDADRLLYRARFMIVVLGVVLGVFVFLWTREWLGFTPAVIALACYTFEPNLSAHASLVTTDLGVTCFIFGTIYFAWLTCRRYSVLSVGGLVACFSLALVSKFSAVLLVPVVLVLLMMSVRRHQGLTVRRAAATIAALAVTAVAVIWASYGFRYQPAPSTSAALSFVGTALVTPSPTVDAVAGWIDAHRLLPNGYTQGFLYAYSSVRQLPGFLAGRISEDGWWSYFPLAFLLKTPTPLILLVAFGAVALIRRRRQVGIHDAAFVVLPIVVFLGIAMWSGINVGLRHILPVYPFAILLAGLAVQELARLPKLMRITALALLATIWAGEYAAAYPHPLTFFNYAAGGPSNGYHYLSDSNLGWGQSLKPLKTWMERHRVTHVNLAYFGQADPAYYGIDCTHLPGAPSFATELIARPKLPGYVAISATTLTGVYAPPLWRRFYAAFRDLEPVAIIGNSIRVYWVDDWPEPDQAASTSEPETQKSLADALLFGFQWPDHAVRHYQAYLAARPVDTSALVNYGLALAAANRTTDAVAALRRAVEADPTHGFAHLTLGRLFLATRDLESAAEHAEQAVRLIPWNADAHFLIARVHAVQRRWGEAARDLERVLEIEPGHVAAQADLQRIAAAEQRRGQPVERGGLSRE